MYTFLCVECCLRHPNYLDVINTMQCGLGPDTTVFVLVRYLKIDFKNLQNRDIFTQCFIGQLVPIIARGLPGHKSQWHGHGGLCQLLFFLATGKAGTGFYPGGRAKRARACPLSITSLFTTHKSIVWMEKIHYYSIIYEYC